jgi:lipopolysaccharide heptosyltransferase II
MRRVLLVRLDLMGDVVHSMHAADALRERFPDAHITMLTLPYTAPLARLSRSIDEVLEVDTNRIRTPGGLASARTWLGYLGVYRQLRSRRYDVAISVYGRMGSLWAFLSGARRTVGYAEEAYPLLLTDPLPGGRHRERIHELQYVRRLTRHAGADEDPDGLDLVVPAAAHAAARELLRRHGISDDERVVVIHAGAVNGSAKRWPEASWARFAEILTSRVPVRIVLVGAAADQPVARLVLEAARAEIASLVGCTDIPSLAGVIARADLVATGDSGPLHVAVALERSVLAVYGPTDPYVYGPYRPRAPTTIHRADLPCSPCYTLAGPAECPLADPICMRLVSVEAMVESALRLLGTS